jgi:hypothetical protein
MNLLTTPDKHHCDSCHAGYTEVMAKQAKLHDAEGVVRCPHCEGAPATKLVPGSTVAEVHLKLCIDETYHYPEWYRAGKITKDKYDAWVATLTDLEKHGHYHRSPPEHFMVSLTAEETVLKDTDVAAFNKVLNEKVRERAENHLRHCHHAHEHKATTHKINL